MAIAPGDRMVTGRYCPFHSQSENLCCSNSLTLPNADSHHLATFHRKLQHIKSTNFAISTYRMAPDFQKPPCLVDKPNLYREVWHDGFPWPSSSCFILLQLQHRIGPMEIFPLAKVLYGSNSHGVKHLHTLRRQNAQC